MRKLAQLLRTGDTTEQRFEGLFATFVPLTRSFDWTWAPATACTTAKLIDGEIRGAECAAFARALQTMAVAPAPFGLGIADGDGSGTTAKYVSFSGEKIGEESPGFVSFHPRQGVLELMPNVYTPVGQPRTPRLRDKGFYVWQNHKVVRFNNIYYDPTYGCQYQNLQDMVALSIVDWEVLGGGSKPKTLAAFEDSGHSDATGKHMLICEDRQRNPQYIRLTPSTLRATEGQYQGPYTQNQRDWLAGQIGDSTDAIRADQIFEAVD